MTVALDHDEGQERANNGTSDQNEDDGKTDGPNTRREKGLRRVRRVDKGLEARRSEMFNGSDGTLGGRHTMTSVQMV